MGTVAEGTLTAVTAVLVILLVATIFGRIHGHHGQASKVGPIGDRVISGLLTLPLIALWVELIDPQASIGWALSAPLPLAIYVVLLSCTSVTKEWAPRSKAIQRIKRLIVWMKDYFTPILLITIGLIYIVFAYVVYY